MDAVNAVAEALARAHREYGVTEAVRFFFFFFFFLFVYWARVPMRKGAA